jgi:hypothetical protein
MCTSTVVCAKGRPKNCPGRNGQPDKCCPKHARCHYGRSGAVTCRKR